MSIALPEAAPVTQQGRSPGRAALWLAGLAPFFYATYGAANWLASLRAHVPVVVFAWERHVPFLDWTIVPYWSTNAFYAASVFVCATRDELDRHGRRLLTAQIVAVACFIAAPLRFSFEKPATSGVYGALFDALGSFDKPFNQAPSLHVALTVILWDLYRRHLPGPILPLFHAWSALVVASVMTTFQHHFIDIPTGALLGFACLWAWPEGSPPPLARLAPTRDRARRRLAAIYAAGAFAIAALILVSVWHFDANPELLWGLWLALSLAMVALAYGAAGKALFQKRADGTISMAALILLAPYRLGAFVNSRMWTRADILPAEVAGDVWLGRFPTASDLSHSPFHSVIDLTAEFAAPRFRGRWRAVPMLDLVAPLPVTLKQAADAIESARADGPVLVCCALGYGRGAAAVATWLARSGRAPDAAQAIERVRAARPRLALSAGQRAALEEAVDGC